METEIQLPFQELLAIAKKLAPKQKAELIAELSQEKTVSNNNDIIDFLLKGPVFNDSEIKIMEENRKSISKWRTKS